MRIVHISDCYAPRTGGIETQVRSLARNQAAQGDEVHVVTATPGHGLVRAGLDADGPVVVHRVAARIPGEIPIHPRTAHHVRAVLDAVRPDVVHVHTGVISPFAWSGLRVSAAMDLPRVVTVHSVWGPLAGPAHRRAARWDLRGFDGTYMTAVSHAAARIVSGALARPVDVLPNGIDPAAWPVRTWSPEPGRLRVVSVARLAPRKRIGALVDAFARSIVVLEPDMRVTADIIGSGPEMARTRRRIARLGLTDRIRLVGRLEPARISEFYRDSDVFVQASVRESFGIAALEARTSGVPVVARSQTGTGEFIESGVNGFLCDDDHGLVQALVALGRDRELLERMRRYNEQNLPKQTWPDVLAVARDIYSRAGA